MAKKVTVIFSHPYFSNSNSNVLIVDALKKFENVTVRNIDKLYPDGKVDAAIEQQALLNSDLIVFQFPLFWFNVPASLKNWIDNVFSYGFAFGSNGDKLKGKDFIVSLTAGGGEDAYSPDKMTIDTLLVHLKAIAHFTGMNYVTSIKSYGMNFIPGVSKDLTEVQEKAKKHAETLIGFFK